ncbi:MAG: hypothetical protein NW241_12585 [Bacteroidia bacterium]|nr:hypothetical protein [Bacteroidia bacterium]
MNKIFISLQPYFSIALFWALGVFSPLACFSQFGKAGSAEDAYKDKKYAEASKLAAEALVEKSTNKKAQEVLIMAYPAAVEDARTYAVQYDNISLDPSNVGIESCQKIIAKYKDVQDIQTLVKSVLPIQDKKTGDLITIELVDFSGEIAAINARMEEIRQIAADNAYESGLRHLAGGSKESAKAAAKAFKECASYISSYKDASSKYQEARALAMKTLVIDAEASANLVGGFNSGLLKDKLIFLLEQGLVSDQKVSEFTKVVSGRSSQGQNTDLVMKVVILDVSLGTPQTSAQKRTETKNIKVGEEQYVDNGKTRTRNVFSDVSAEVTEFTRIIESSVTIGAQLVNNSTGEIMSMSQSSYSGNFIQQDVWASFIGDQRAVSTRSSSLVSAASRVPPIPPSQDQLNTALEYAVKNLITELGRVLN